MLYPTYSSILLKIPLIAGTTHADATIAEISLTKNKLTVILTPPALIISRKHYVNFKILLY